MFFSYYWHLNFVQNMDKLSIYVANIAQYIETDGGTSLAKLWEGIKHLMPDQPICARVNNKTESLDFVLYQPKMVEFQTISQGSGPRVYTRSLCMLLYRAAQSVVPELHLRFEHSISHGYYCRFSEIDRIDEGTVDKIKREMERLVALNLPFKRHEIRTVDAASMFEIQGLPDKAELLRTIHEIYTTFYTLDGIADSYYGSLAPSTGFLKVFNLIPYEQGMLLLPFDMDNPSKPATPIIQQKMYNAFKEYLRISDIIGVTDVGQLNSCVIAGSEARLIQVAETLHDKSIARISDDIAERYRNGGARIVLVAGPSSSGKTTTTKRLAVHLITNLLKPQMISLDNYFVNRENTPLDSDGEYDYESLYALDLKQFNTDLNAILRGEEVELPYYNFELGCRQYRGDKIKLEEGSVLLIEGIHGLNPELTAEIPEMAKYRIYVSCLTTLSIDEHNWVPTTDNRLLRRIVRDYKYRGVNAEETIRRWPSVRRGEEKWIFPYQENADAVFNSSLIFELSVMKDEGEHVLRSVPSDVPEYAEAYRLRKFLSYFLPIESKFVPSTSLLREFLGGSSFKY